MICAQRQNRPAWDGPVAAGIVTLIVLGISALGLGTLEFGSCL